MSRFALDMNNFAKKCGEKADVVVRKVCLDLMSSIILKTPVDTGRARANWQATIGQPAGGVVAFSGDAGRGITAPSRSAASAQAVLAGAGAVSKASGNVFWLTNNLPYISVLEFGRYSGDGPNTVGGYSKQAPAGMVRISIEEVKRALR